MSAAKKQITREDILPLEKYAAERKERRTRITQMKKNRRVEVGPYATFYFENYDTMFQQIHEMLFIEKGGEEQIADELSAYNPLIPQGKDLVCTLMFEIDDPIRRNNVLRRLAHVEEHVYVQVGEEKIMADAEDDVERTTEDGKTSSVHFLHFRFTPEQIAKFKDPSLNVILGIGHENYGHMALLAGPTREALAADFSA
jgi:hypothetical protein